MVDRYKHSSLFSWTVTEEKSFITFTLGWIFSLQDGASTSHRMNLVCSTNSLKSLNRVKHFKKTKNARALLFLLIKSVKENRTLKVLGMYLWPVL
jgi:hypothetical protein